MLVLTRKSDEAILIGDEVRVYVLRIRGGRVRLGIDAPQQIVIMREELRKDQASADLNQPPTETRSSD